MTGRLRHQGEVSVPRSQASLIDLVAVNRQDVLLLTIQAKVDDIAGRLSGLTTIYTDHCGAHPAGGCGLKFLSAELCVRDKPTSDS